MKKVLLFIDWYTPAFKAGGPVKSVVNLVDALYENCAFDVVTSDRDFGDAEPYKNIVFNQWINTNKNVRLMYLNPDSIFKKIRKILNEDKSDFIYLNSLFSIPFSILPLLLSKFTNHKIILAPRGMLGKGALEIKPLKKKLFLAVFKALLLDKNIIWQATSLEEESEILFHFPDAKIKFAPNLGSQTNSPPIILEKEKNRLKLCFISRISVKKNLIKALEILKLMESHSNFKSNIVFDIFGPTEDFVYWKKCNDFIQNQNWTKIKINYFGELLPEHIHGAVSNYHFLLLPTLNENFGHIILETLSAGRPVIISDQTPWRNLKEKNIGLDFSLDDEKTVFNELIRFCEMNDDEFQMMVRSVNEFVIDYNKQAQTLIFSENLFH